MLDGLLGSFKDGFYVNLGIGLPTMIAGIIPAGIDVMFQSGERDAGGGWASDGGAGRSGFDQCGEAAGDGDSGVARFLGVRSRSR